MARRAEDDDRPSFPPHLEKFNPADGWADRDEWWDVKIAFAREHGVFGRTVSGRGKILPLLQAMVSGTPADAETNKKNDNNTERES